MLNMTFESIYPSSSQLYHFLTDRGRYVTLGVYRCERLQGGSNTTFPPTIKPSNSIQGQALLPTQDLPYKDTNMPKLHRRVQGGAGADTEGNPPPWSSDGGRGGALFG